MTSNQISSQTQFERSKWDPALEDLLKTDNYQDINTKWTERNLYYISETKTFMEAIDNKPQHKKNPAVTEDPTRTKENHIRHLILKPLSPRKPTVVPRSTSSSIHRDKQGLEQIVKQRSQKQARQQLSNYYLTKDNQSVARPSTLPRLQFSSYGSRKPTYYWGV